ncbi:putative hydrolase of the HAD superfamily [Marinococcus luteus]|uniref:Putative hydrolase of the HAD superfamily n=1 Tax=Marinococcus luteus TaxID=1122204 RepID=A0A1H2RY55_9BACI|nr:HAD family hydrolase [Marinococcus luteus]SDW24228.1 putative hydrolase of the HAD superfamily [Marinococcus luteus]
MRWTTICFDLDNTLYDHEKAFQKTIKAVFVSIRQQLNKEAPFVHEDKWFEVFKYHCDLFWQEYEEGILTQEQYRIKRYVETMHAFGLPGSGRKALEFHQEYEQRLPEFSELFESVPGLLESLAKSSVCLGIITNGSEKLQKEKFYRLQLDRWIDHRHLFISEMAEAPKPKTAIFDEALELLGSRKKRALFVGDSWAHDVEGAENAGWEAIYVNTRGEEAGHSSNTVKEFSEFNQAASYLREIVEEGRRSDV